MTFVDFLTVMYKSPTSPSERLKHRKIVSVVEREFLAQEGHDDDPVTFVRITNLALRDSVHAKQQLTKRMIDKYLVEN